MLKDKFLEQFWQTLQKKLVITDLKISKIDKTEELVVSFIKNDQLYGIRVPCNEIQKLIIVGVAPMPDNLWEDGDMLVDKYRRKLVIDEGLLYLYLEKRIFLIT